MSLRLRVVLIAGISLVVLWVAAATWMMQGVYAKFDQTLDGRLAMSARMVSGLLDGVALDSNASFTGFTEAVRVSGNDGIACEIRVLRGKVLARTGSTPSSDFETLPTGYSTRTVEGSQWRIYVLRDNGYQITTADRLEERVVLVNDLLRAASVPFFIAFFGGLGALWIGIGRGLAPLKALREQLRDKETDDTTPIFLNRPPTELRPVLNAMNGLLKRLAQALSRQRAFTDAAAHELRTPLTVIDTHLQVAQLSEGQEARASLRDAEEGVQRLRRTLDQMMTLARTEVAIEQGDACASVLATVHSVLDQAGINERSRLSLIVDGADAGTPIPKSMLETAVRNLVDNAIRYSPDDTVIEMSVFFDWSTQHCLLAVADRGPGLNAEQASRIGQRFWRGDQGQQRQEGAGLGISIVRAIVERFGGTLKLSPREGGGLVAEILIPFLIHGFYPDSTDTLEIGLSEP